MLTDHIPIEYLLLVGMYAVVVTSPWPRTCSTVSPTWIADIDLCVHFYKLVKPICPPRLLNAHVNGLTHKVPVTWFPTTVVHIGGVDESPAGSVTSPHS